MPSYAEYNCLMPSKNSRAKNNGHSGEILVLPGMARLRHVSTVSFFFLLILNSPNRIDY